ncbi:MAG: IS1595 family transposase [Syntrophaceae bacterium]|nr:IS1595 family transposase [Syntrophaceae bacterium]
MSQISIQSLLDLDRVYPTENDRENLLFSLRWPNGFICPQCGACKYWPIKKMFQCASCGYKASVKSGTIFEHTRKSLKDWFALCWLVIKDENGINAKSAARLLRFGSYETAWTMLHKLRRAMIAPDEKLSGVVNLDEVFIGSIKYVRKRKFLKKRAIVLIAVQKDGNNVAKIKLRRIDNPPSPSVINKATVDFINNGSIIQTDKYYDEKFTFAGYHHMCIRESSSIGNNLIPGCEIVAKDIRKWLRKTIRGGFSVNNLDYYLDEFTFRFNNRNNDRDRLFYKLLEQAVKTEKKTYNNITDKK